MFCLRPLPRRSLRVAFWRYGGSLTLALAVMCQPGWARTNTIDWDNLRALDAGSGIWVRTKAGKKYHGEFVHVTEDMLWFNSDEAHFPGRRWIQRRVPRENVKEVRHFSQGAAIAVSSAIGLAIGVGIGAAIDAKAPVPNDDPHLGVVIFGMLGGMFGTAVGSHGTFIKGRTIYRSS